MDESNNNDRDEGPSAFTRKRQGSNGGNADDGSVSLSSMSYSPRRFSSWHMHGRQTAVEKEPTDMPLRSIAVPPVSILNAVTFDVIGQPDVCMLSEETMTIPASTNGGSNDSNDEHEQPQQYHDRLMRWTCMYRADLLQTHWKVHDFPHDRHDILLRLAIMQHRSPGGQWDRSMWRLGLATSEDSQGSTAIPYGLLVSHVRVPGFSFDPDEGLMFDFVDMNEDPQQEGRARYDGRSRNSRRHRPGHHYYHQNQQQQEVCLEAKLTVLRNSTYYDSNIMPLFALLNVSAVCMLALPPIALFMRGLLLLNISFVVVNLRMTTDKHLPIVSYQIKMQRIMNEYFFVLIGLVFESTAVYTLKLYHLPTLWLEILTAVGALLHNAYTLYTYYGDARRAKRRLYKNSAFAL